MQKAKKLVAEPAPFAQEAHTTMLRIRATLGQVIESCGVAAHGVQRAHRRLGIDKKLAWRLAKVLQSEDPYAAARHMPGMIAMRTLFQHAERHGTPEQLIRDCRAAMGAFDRLVGEHAGSRKAFELMLAAHATSGVEETDVIHRREATVALSYTCGVIARAQVRTHLVRPSRDTPGTLDIGVIAGFAGLQWVRPNVAWPIHHRPGRAHPGPYRAPSIWFETDDRPRPPNPDGAPVPVDGAGPVRGEPLDPSVESGDVPLLARFCSDLPSMRRVAIEQGVVVDELVQQNVGTSSAVTCLTGELFRDVAPEGEPAPDPARTPGPAKAPGPAGSQAPTHRAVHVARARTPCELLLFDLLLHRDLLTDTPPELHIFADLELGSDALPVHQRTRHRMMAWHDVEHVAHEHVAQGVKGAYTPYLPQYVDVLGWCLQRLAWVPSQFELFRTVVPHPVVPSTVGVR